MAWCSRDRLAEGLALLRVADGLLERALCDPDAARRDVDAAELDRAHEVLESLTDARLAAEHAGRGRPEPVEHELGRLHALVSELLQRRRDREAGLLRHARLLLEDERRHASVRGICVGIGLREQHDEAGAQPVRRPHLLAGDHVVVAVANGRRADRLHVRARMRLRHRVGRAHLAFRHAREVALTLVVRAVLLDHPRGQEVRVEHAGQRHPATRELDLDQHVRRQIEPEAAVLLRDDHPEEAEALHLLDERLGERIRVLELRGRRDHLRVHPRADRGDDLRLLGDTHRPSFGP